MINPLLKIVLSFITPYQLNWSAAVTAFVGLYSSNRASAAAKRASDASIASQERLSAESLAETKRQYDLGRADLDPYRQAGTEALGTYQGLLSQYQPGQLPSFTGQYQDPGAFQGVTNLEDDPGYQFRKEQGLEALDRMMAKGGKRFSGERGISLQRYGQDLASQEYGAAYGRSLQEYGLDVQRAGSQYDRQLGQYGLDYGRSQDIDKQQLSYLGQYANLAASGQQAAGATSTLGANYAAATSNIRGSTADAISAAQTYGGQAQAAGYLGMGNAVSSGLAAYQYNQGLSNYAGQQGGPQSYDYGQNLDDNYWGDYGSSDSSSGDLGW